MILFKLLLIYAVTLPLMKTPLPFRAYGIILSDGIFLFLFILWLNELIKNKRVPQDTGLNKPFLAFMAFCLLSFFHSSNVFISTIELLKLIYLYVMFVLVIDIVDSKRKLDTIIKFWIGALTAVLALGFIGLCITIITGKENLFSSYVYHGDFSYIENKIIYRMTSTFIYPAALANYLIISLGFVISDLLLTENKRYKIFLKIIIFFTCLTMFATITRDIVPFFFCLFLIYNHFHKVKNLRFKIIRFSSLTLIILIFLVITVFFASFYIRSYKIENLSKEMPDKEIRKELVVNIDYAYDMRLVLKIAALEMVRRHPFLGVGLRMFRSYLMELNNENWFYLKNLVPIYFITSISGSQYLDYMPKEADTHMDVLQYFAETGILGGSAFIFFIAVFLYLVLTNLKKRDDRYFNIRLFCFFVSFIGVLIESIYGDFFKSRPMWFLMALTLALITMRKDKVDEKNQGPLYNH